MKEKKRRIEYEQKVAFVKSLALAYKSYQMHIRCQLYHKTRMQALLTIQTNLRMAIKYYLFQRLKRSALLIQKMYRGYVQRKFYHKNKRAIKLLIKHIRPFLARLKLTKKARAVLRIQSWIRMKQ